MRIHTIAGLLTALLLVIGASAHGTGSPVVSGIAAEPIHGDLSSGTRFAQDRPDVKGQRQACGACLTQHGNRICKDRGLGPAGPAVQACRVQVQALGGDACTACQKEMFCDAICARE
jgi:hypothetical protein